MEIPSLDLSVRIYQGTDSKTLAKGVGHFEDTSIWNGNVCLAAHNRGANSYFGQIHTLDIGDKITLTTKLGTRTYKVTDVFKVSETDRGGLADSGENMLTLYTCVRNQRDSAGASPQRRSESFSLCRIGSVRLLPLTCDMVKLRRKFSHIHS